MRTDPGCLLADLVFGQFQIEVRLQVDPETLRLQPRLASNGRLSVDVNVAQPVDRLRCAPRPPRCLHYSGSRKISLHSSTHSEQIPGRFSSLGIRRVTSVPFRWQKSQTLLSHAMRFVLPISNFFMGSTTGPGFAGTILTSSVAPRSPWSQS